MANNDVIVLNSILEQKQKEVGAGLKEDEYFEIFVFEQLLKDFDLSYEELMIGKTGASDDGGIDGFFLLINNETVNEESRASDFRKSPIIDLFLIQAKREGTFTESTFEKILTTFQDIFDLDKNLDKLKKYYNSALLEKAKLFKNLYIALASKHPKLNINFYYASKGQVSKVHPKIENKAKLLRETANKYFSNSIINVNFLGARELLDLSRIEKTYTLSLNFVETYLSKGQDNYVVLSNLPDYYRFVIDDNHSLRKYIFDANVRDFQGSVEVNKDIEKTLKEGGNCDFWWLNNGITILASKATTVSKKITLDNVQIVNGLQTTRCIYDYVRWRETNGEMLSENDKNKSILIKIIVTDDPATRDRIIKATNFQTSIPPASLRATDRLQRNIEDFFQKHGLYYDRRKNYYKNIGKPLDKIISISYLAQTVMAIILREPDNARARPASLIKKEDNYRRVFNEETSPSIYLFCAQLMKLIENYLKNNLVTYPIQDKNNLKFHIATVLTIKIIKSKTYSTQDLADIGLTDANDKLLSKASANTLSLANRYAKIRIWSIERVVKSPEFVRYLIQKI